MTKNRIIALILMLVISMSLVLTSCNKPPVVEDEPGNGDGGSTVNPDGGNNEQPEEEEEEDLTFKLPYAAGTTLRMATGYNSTKTGISFTGDSGIGEGITLADGVTYHVGDLKPTWVEVQNVLSVVFEDKYTGKSAKDEYDYWKQQLAQVDMVSGTATQLSEAGTAGDLVNLADYLDDMPNFKKYLNENPIVLLSISAVDTNGYFTRHTAEGYVYQIGIHVYTGIAQCTQDTAPVRVCAEHCRFKKA